MRLDSLEKRRFQTVTGWNFTEIGAAITQILVYYKYKDHSPIPCLTKVNQTLLMCISPLWTLKCLLYNKQNLDMCIILEDYTCNCWILIYRSKYQHWAFKRQMGFLNYVLVSWHGDLMAWQEWTNTLMYLQVHLGTFAQASWGFGCILVLMGVEMANKLKYLRRLSTNQIQGRIVFQLYETSNKINTLIYFRQCELTLRWNFGNLVKLDFFTFLLFIDLWLWFWPLVLADLLSWYITSSPLLKIHRI